MKRISILVSGKVQGVFYRKFTDKTANQLGISGFVRNETNGNVYIEAQGTAEQLAEFVKACQEGPDRAVVGEIISKEIQLEKEESFRIMR